MPATYTASLRLTKPSNGDTNWGTTVNSGATDLTDTAIAGYTTVSMPSNADYTLTSSNGVADQARSMMLNITSAVSLTVTRNIICPAVSKLYFIKNATTGGQAIVLKTASGSGITIPNGATMVLVCNGIDVLEGVTNISSLSLGSLTLTTPLAATSGGTGQSSYAVGDIIYASTTTALSKLAGVATGNSLISGGVGVAPSWGKIGLTTHVSGTLPVANGGTGITSFGANVATWLGTPTSANLAAAITDETGSGALVFATSPTLVTPALGTPTSGNFSTGTFTWPTFNQNTTGNAATATSATSATTATNVSGGTASVTTLSASSTVSGAGFTARFSSPGNIGNTTPSNGTFTNLTATASFTSTNDATINSFVVGRGGGNSITNTAFGSLCLSTNSAGVSNSAFGNSALFQLETGGQNTSVGGSALYSIISGNGNTAVGYFALNAATANYNTAIGYVTGQNISTGAGNVVIGSATSTGTHAPVFNVTTQDHRISLGSTSITNAYVQVAWTVVSDARDKTNFAEVPHGLEFVNKLKPIAYQYKTSRDSDVAHGPVRYGFKAQDVLALEGQHPVIVDAEDVLRLKFNDQSMIAVLVKAIQEQQTLIKDLQNRLAVLEAS